MRGGVESRPAGCGSRSVAVSAASVSTHVWACPRMRSGEVVMRENSVITWRHFIMRITLTRPVKDENSLFFEDQTNLAVFYDVNNA